MNILWFNWKDILNPEKGGAEIYTYEIAKRLVKKGYSVTLFTSKFKGCKKEEFVDNIKIVREGGKITVYLKAINFCKKNYTKFDIIIDEINTIPFLTPKFAKNVKVIALIHQLAKEFWFYETSFPINLIGYHILEPKLLKYYVNIPTITVSNSTKTDLEKLGFKKIFVVHNGLNVKPLNKIPEKYKQPVIIFVGRMKKAKKPQDVIKAFKIVKKEVGNVILWMVGDGYLRKKLEKISKETIKFFGYVSNKTKNELIKKAWVIAVPGVREGWGQVVTDANALGTPAVGYNIPGLKDSIKHGYNGILVETNPEALAEGIIEILTNNNLRKKLSRNAIKWAKKFSWDKSAKQFEKIIKSVVES